MKTVGDLLARKTSAEVWSISPVDTVYSAIERMSEKEIGALLVVQDEAPVGIISERDYARKVILKDKASKQVKVSEIMTRDLIRVTSAHRVEACMRLMSRHHIRHLPVIDEGRVVGMVSLRDLLSATIDEQASAIEQMEHYVRGEV